MYSIIRIGIKTYGGIHIMDIKNAERAERALKDAVMRLMELNASDNPAVSFIAMELLTDLVKIEQKTTRFKEIIKQLDNE